MSPLVNEHRGRGRHLAAFLSLGVGRGSALILQALVIGLQARAMGVTDFAVHASALAAFFLLLTATDFGLAVRALRIGSEAPELVSALAWARIASCLPIPLLTVGVLKLAGTQHTALIICTAVFVAGETCGELSVSVLLGQRNRAKAVLLMNVRRLAALAPLLFWSTTDAAAAGLAASGVLGIVVCLMLALRHPRQALEVRATVRDTLPFWGPSIGTSLQRFDILIVAAVAPVAVVGYYGAASRISNPLGAVTNLVLQYTVPELASSSPGDRRRILRFAQVITLVWALILLGAATVSEPLTRLMLGDAFSDAWPIVMAVFVGAAFSAVGQLWLSEMYAHGLPPGLSTAILAAVVAGLLVLSIGTYLLGAWGAALGLLANFAFVTLAIAFIKRRSSRGVPQMSQNVSTPVPNGR